MSLFFNTEIDLREYNFLAYSPDSSRAYQSKYPQADLVHWLSSGEKTLFNSFGLAPCVVAVYLVTRKSHLTLDEI